MLLSKLFGRKIKGEEIVPSVAPAQEGPSGLGLLGEAMVEAARGDSPETRRRVYQELLFSDLLVALEESPEARLPGLPPGKQVLVRHNTAGIPGVFAFTSRAFAEKFVDSPDLVSLRGQDALGLLASGGGEAVVVNAGSLPFLLLTRDDAVRLSKGIVPESRFSPVRSELAPSPGADASPGSEATLAFPPGIFNEEQTQRLRKVLATHHRLEAASVAVARPPGAPENAWMRVVFLKVKGEPLAQEQARALCQELVRDVRERNTLFDESPFEFAVMSDPPFWEAMVKENLLLFGKQPVKLEVVQK